MISSSPAMDVLCYSNKYYKIINRARCIIHDNPSLYWRTVVHVCFLLHHGYMGVYTCQLKIEDHENPIFSNMYKYKVAFLTGWNMMFQGIFLGLSFTYDVLEWQDNHQGTTGARIRYWRDVLYGGLVVPFTLFVSSIFWGVFSIDRELIFPKLYEEVIPWWLSFCVHANINVVLVLETLVQERRKPTNWSLEMFLCYFFSIGYAVVIYSIYALAGLWLYEFFKVMNFWQICLYQIGCWITSYTFYSIQFPINRLIHGSKEIKQHKDN